MCPASKFHRSAVSLLSNSTLQPGQGSDMRVRHVDASSISARRSRPGKPSTYCPLRTMSVPHSLLAPLPSILPPPSRAHAHRERRLAQQDAKRQKLRQDLERKEREGEKTRSEEEQARARLKVGEVEE
jgi:hypothetical protein